MAFEPRHGAFAIFALPDQVLHAGGIPGVFLTQSIRHVRRCHFP